MKIRTLLASLGTALALTLSSSAWAGYTLSMSASQTSGVAGADQTVIDVILDLDSSDNVDALGFFLDYDSSILQFKSGLATSLFDPNVWFLLDFIDHPATGVFPPAVEFFALSLDPGIGIDGPVVNGTIAQITFDLLAAGSSPLTLSDVIVSGLGAPLAGLPGTVSQGIFINVSAPANQAPAPASLLLVGLGLALLGWTRRNAAAPNAG